MNSPFKKSATEKQRRLRSETCDRLAADGLPAHPATGVMAGDLINSNGFPWLEFGISEKCPTVQEISDIVRRPDTPGFIAVMQPTEFPFAVVEWRTFAWLMSLARDCEEAKVREAHEQLENKLGKMIAAMKAAAPASETPNE